jgi:ABC-type multidrug transport system fused ATPase/permease subunit
MTFGEIVALLLRTWPYIKPVRWYVVAWFSWAMGIGVIAGAVAFSGADLLNNKIINGDPVQPGQAAVLFLDTSYVETDALTDDQRRVLRTRFIIAAIVFTALVRMVADLFIVVFFETWISQRINQNLRVKMIENAEHLSLAYQSHARTGDAIYRVFQDSRMISNVIATVILDPLEQGFAMLGALVVVWFFSPLLGAIFLAALVPIFFLARWWTPRIQRRAWMARQSNSDLTSTIQEAAETVRVVKANQAEGRTLARFDRDSKVALNNAYYLRMELLVFYIVMALIVGSVLIGAEYLMARWTIIEQETFLGGLFTFILGFAVWNLGAFQQARENNADALGKFSFLFITWFAAIDMVMGLKRAYFLLDLEPGVAEKPGAAPMPQPIREIRYDDVHFAYEPGKPVLDGVTFAARAGTITAVVGNTGSGKSTLMSLLLRLYDPARGSISVNGLDLRDLEINAIRKKVAIALQQNVLFAATVADNIGYAAEVSRDEVERAAAIACADEFITDMPHGYDTELGERGGKLSTGQRQRLSIARALVRDTPILILDEPTASLDAETEHRVLANLSDWGSERVVFVITHRLSTIRNADQIIFLKDGHITEIGDHDSLMARPDGDYRQFVVEETHGPEEASA